MDQYTVTLSVGDNEGYESIPDDQATCTVYVQDPTNLDPTQVFYVKHPGYGNKTGVDWDNAFATIQKGIHEISNIGKVCVWWEDTYEENIDFQGKNVLLVSANAADEIVPGAIIQGNGTRPVVRFSGAEDNSCQIIGFTITGGDFVDPEGSDPWLQAHWKLDEDSNVTAHDETSNDNDGTLAGDPTPTWVVDGGRYSGALQFDGVDDWVDVPYNASLNPFDFTVSLWMKADPPDPSNHRTLVSGADPWATNDPPNIHITGYWLTVGPGTDKLHFFTGRGGDPYWDKLIADNYDVPFYAWTHVAFTFEATSGPDEEGRYTGIKKIFANGKEIERDEAAEYIPMEFNETQPQGLRMGNVNWRNDGIQFYQGDMDEVWIYDRALNDGEIFQLAGPAAHWKLDEEDGVTTFKDETGHFDGTLTNMEATQWCDGWQGGALEFDGVDDYVSMDNVVNPYNDSFSAFAWVRLDAQDGDISQTILQQENKVEDQNETVGRSWLYRDSATDKLASYLGGEPTLSNMAVFANTFEWHHVGMTFDGTTVRLYIDGQKNGADNDISVEAATGDMRLGAQKVPANSDFAYWDGLIDEVRIYDRVLDADDMQRLYMTYRGGGIHCNHAEPVISHCVITGNSAQYGAGISDCDGIIENCLITNNTILDGGIGSGIAGSRQAEIINCTIADNDGYGLYDCGPEGLITNSIIWCNTSGQLENCILPTTFSCIQDWGAGGGTGNIDSDPDFVDPGSQDYHLQPTSPCINKGDPDHNPGEGTDIDGDARVIGSAIDIGADEVECKTVYYVDLSANPDGDGYSWTTAFTDLQLALNAAVPGDEIHVAAIFDPVESRYVPYLPTDSADQEISFEVNGISLYGGYPPGGGNESTRDPVVYKTILSGDLGIQIDFDNPQPISDWHDDDSREDNSYHVVKILPSNFETIIDGFIIESGFAADSYGGGIYASQPVGRLLVQNCTVKDNYASFKGGGLYCSGMDVSLILGNCTIMEIASGVDAGGVYIHGANSDSMILQSILHKNYAPGNGSGGYLSYSRNKILLTVISENTAYAKGGGLYLQGDTDLGSPEISKCTFYGNVVSVGSGGAIYNLGTNFNLTYSILWDDSATTGPEIHNDVLTDPDNIGTPTVSFSDIEGGYPGVGNMDPPQDPLFVGTSNVLGADGFYYIIDDGLRLGSESPCEPSATNEIGMGAYQSSLPWAYDPSPAHGSKDQPTVVVFQWQPGVGAARHILYLGTNPNSLQKRYEGTETYYAHNQALEPYTRYYWRVDEEYLGNSIPGKLWSFMTGEDVYQSIRPLAWDQTIEGTYEESPIYFYVDAAPAGGGYDRSNLTYFINIGAQLGVVSIDMNNLTEGARFKYEPAEEIGINDSFSYKVHDGNTFSEVATVNLRFSRNVENPPIVVKAQDVWVIIPITYYQQESGYYSGCYFQEDPTGPVEFYLRAIQYPDCLSVTRYEHNQLVGDIYLENWPDTTDDQVDVWRWWPPSQDPENEYIEATMDYNPYGFPVLSWIDDTIGRMSFVYNYVSVLAKLEGHFQYQAYWDDPMPPHTRYYSNWATVHIRSCSEYLGGCGSGISVGCPIFDCELWEDTKIFIPEGESHDTDWRANQRYVYQC